MSAPAFIKVLTTSLCPLSAARISGVFCCYKIKLLRTKRYGCYICTHSILIYVFQLNSYVAIYTYMIIRYMKRNL